MKNELIINIEDLRTNEITTIDFNKIDYFEEGINKKNNHACVLLKMKNGEVHIFEMSYDKFMYEVKKLLEENEFEGFLYEY
jgi:hypothetical protein